MKLRRIVAILLTALFILSIIPFSSIAAPRLISVTVQTQTFAEGTHGWYVVSETEGEDPVEWFEYDVAPDEIEARFSDSSTVVCTPEELEEMTGIGFFYNSDQRPDNQWGPGEHTATVEWDGGSFEYTVVIVETDVLSISATGRSIVENTECWWYTELKENGEVSGSWRYYDAQPENVTVCYKNGDEVTYNAQELEELTGFSAWYITDQTEGEWGVGKHRVRMFYKGVMCEYEIEITESPIASISIERQVREEGDLYYDFIFDEDGGLVWLYKYDSHPDKVTISFKDGSSAEYDLYELSDVFDDYGVIDDDQTPENVWGIGVHKATFTLLGISCEFEVEVVASPIVSIEQIGVCEITQGADVMFDYDYDPDTGERTPIFLRYRYEPQFEVVLENGDVIYTYGGFDYEGKYYRVNTTDNQSYENQWGPGTYTAQASVGGKKCDVTVVIKESSVERVEFDPIVLRENVDGSNSFRFNFETGNDEEFFRYEYYPEYTAYLKDGTAVRSERGWIDLGGERVCVACFDDQSEEPWGIGEHDITLSVAGCTETISVNVVPNNIESISISGDFDLVLTVNYTDGTSEDFTATDFEENEAYSGYIGGTLFTDGGVFSAKLNYGRTENGVEMYDRDVSLQIGSFVSNKLDLCRWLRLRKLKDAATYFTAVASAYNGFSGYGSEEPDADSVALIALYSYAPYDTATDYYEEEEDLFLAKFPVSTVKEAVEYAFDIADFDVTRMEYYDPEDPDGIWVKVPGFIPDIYGGVDASRDDNGWHFVLRIENDYFDVDSIDITTDDDLVITSIDVASDPNVVSLEISGDTELILTATLEDGSVVSASAEDFITYNPGGFPLEGILVTDAGDADVSFRFDVTDDNCFRFVSRNLSVTTDGVTSNTLTDNAWFKSISLGNSLIFVSSIFKAWDPSFKDVDVSKGYDVNDLVMYAVYATGSFENCEFKDYNGEIYISVPAHLARELVRYVFGIENVDLSGYRQIVTEGREELDVPVADFDFEELYSGSVSVRYDEASETWYAEMNVEDSKDDVEAIKITADRSFNVKSIVFVKKVPSFKPGDVNGDGELNMKDVLMVRRAIAGLETLTAEQKMRADANGDGEVNMKDVLKMRRKIAGLE